MNSKITHTVPLLPLLPAKLLRYRSDAGFHIASRCKREVTVRWNLSICVWAALDPVTQFVSLLVHISGLASFAESSVGDPHDLGNVYLKKKEGKMIWRHALPTNRLKPP